MFTGGSIDCGSGGTRLLVSREYSPVRIIPRATRSRSHLSLHTTVPADWNRDGTFRHTLEGDDDMPGHVKSSMMGVSLNIPIRNGRLALGTWQGIYLNEHRDQGGWGGGHTRNIVVTLQGQS